MTAVVFQPATIDQALAGYRAHAAATEEAVEAARLTGLPFSVWMRRQDDPKDRAFIVSVAGDRQAVEAEHGPVLWISTERPEGEPG